MTPTRRSLAVLALAAVAFAPAGCALPPISFTAKPTTSPTPTPSPTVAPVPAGSPQDQFLVAVRLDWTDSARLPDVTLADLGWSTCKVLTDGGTPADVLVGVDADGRDTARALLVAAGTYLCPAYAATVRPWARTA